MVGSSLQFAVPSYSFADMERFCGLCKARGVPVAWFGRGQWLGFTSTAKHWEYSRSGDEPVCLPQTEQVLKCLVDLPLYHTATWQDQDFEHIAAVLCQAIDDVRDHTSPQPQMTAP